MLYTMTKQKELIFSKNKLEEAKATGYPIFNTCNHYLVDMSHLDPKSDDWMNTISVKLPNNNYVTFCVMQTSNDESCIDVKFHGDNLKDHRVYAFGQEGEDVNVYNKSIYALIAHAKSLEKSN